MEHILSNIPPFCLHENIYFVGSSRVSVHLIQTEKGLLLIDTGYPDMLEQILESISLLGFDIKDVVAILHTHGHVDHFGCTERIRALCGAKTYISRIDNDILNGKRDLSWAKEIGIPRLPFFDCDVLLEDGSELDFGNVQIKCIATPGHTEGTLSFYITVHGKTDFTAAMHGGIGMNSLSEKFLLENGLSLDSREQFRQGLHRLSALQVDLVLGNHPRQSGTEEKLAKVQRGECALDPAQWQVFLQSAEKSLDRLLEKERAEAGGKE